MGKKYQFFLLATVLFMSVASNASEPLHKKAKEDANSLVVTYIDTSEASLKLTHAQAQRLQPEPVLWYRFGLNPDGILYNDLIGPGIYFIEELGGVSNKRGMSRRLPSQGPGTLAVEIKKPGIYFLGAYKLKRIEPKDFGFTRYELQRIKNPTEKEVLSKMLNYAKRPAKKWKFRINRVWEERLKQRIRQLR